MQTHNLWQRLFSLLTKPHL